jgi:uncharacterized pyridoxamine 5'-phosphate oxidase family protein
VLTHTERNINPRTRTFQIQLIIVTRVFVLTHREKY